MHLTDDGGTAFVMTKAELLPDLPPSDRFRVFAVDVATGTPRLVTDDWRVSPEAVSADGRVMLVTYQVDDSKLVPAIVDTSTGQIVRRLFDEAGNRSGCCAEL